MVLAPKSWAISVARLEKCVADEFDDFIRAIAENDIRAFESEFFGDRVAERPGTAIGVKMGALQSFPHCLNGQRRGAEGVFVRGEFDDLRGFEAHFAGEFFHRFAGFVGQEIQDMRMRGRFHFEEGGNTIRRKLQ
jgi:hypothetical protein